MMTPFTLYCDDDDNDDVKTNQNAPRGVYIVTRVCSFFFDDEKGDKLRLHIQKALHESMTSKDPNFCRVGHCVAATYTLRDGGVKVPRGAHENRDDRGMARILKCFQLTAVRRIYK
jgi:hypothetical protein